MYKILLAFLYLSLIAVPAFAGLVAFEEIDTDQNGAISGSEITAAGISVEAFIQADVNKDKQLSIDEYAAVFTEPQNSL